MTNDIKELIEKLEKETVLSEKEYTVLLKNRNSETADYLFEKARAVREKIYGKEVFTRGLIEFTNFCKNDCLYCGIRKSNLNAERYRLTKEDILKCCRDGYDLGFRTFVLQGGEDFRYRDDDIVSIVSSIKDLFPDCAVTLSIGEKSKESYQKYFDAGAERYLLRHETANQIHYKKLHPKEMSLANRKRCLYDLKEIGYQVGCGIMVGSPFQTTENIVEDLMFMKELNPHMVGIGPFIPHKDTMFSAYPSGSLELTLFLLGIIRLSLPNVLLPATTALSTICPQGREKGILAGANVVMPNLSPEKVRKKYLLYDNKICTGDESAGHRLDLERRMNDIGYTLAISRGDYRYI